jgi:peptidoglycan/LPS O-acetylase OafA/YrhL
MIVAANVARFVLLARHNTSWQIWANTFTHLDAMAGGILLAILLRRRLPQTGSWLRTALIGFGALAIASVGYFDEIHIGVSRVSVQIGGPLIALGCLSIVCGVLGMRFRRGFLQYLGKISYGLYVYHLACIRISDRLLHVEWGIAGILLRICLALGLTILISALSYRFLESPFLELKKRFTFIDSRPV